MSAGNQSWSKNYTVNILKLYFKGAISNDLVIYLLLLYQQDENLYAEGLNFSMAIFA